MTYSLQRNKPIFNGKEFDLYFMLCLSNCDAIEQFILDYMTLSYSK